MEEVKNLTQSGHFSTVAHPKPFAQELQFTSSSTYYANFESRELIFNNIMAALQDSDVKMIGVYGTGGVGKTTMVEEIGKQVKNGLFDEVLVAVVSQDANVSNIQGQLADRLSLKLKGEIEVGKANELWNRLNNGKKNLIILDDIWQELNLKTIGIPITDGNNCCKVVITSRIRGVLEKMHVDRYVPMRVLLEKEAWAPFKTKVGNSVDSPELHDMANAVCKECGGLPVAILAVGAALKDKKKYVWEDELDQFKDSMLKNIAGIDPKVYASLKLSYHRLESSDAKSCFLLCCFFPEDANISIEVLARRCIARSLLGQNRNTLIRASHRVRIVVDILEDACLLLEGKDENFVKMHDVIRDVALSIAKDDGKEILVKHGDKKWPEKDTCESSSAMSLRFDNTLELPGDLLCPQLHTLTILKRNFRRYPLLDVPDRFFNNCELRDIAILKDLNNNLEILSLRGSNIEVLPSKIGQLTHLRLLDLGNCEKLTEIPQGVISNLSRLEELYIFDCFDQWEATTTNNKGSNVSLDELMNLTQLTTLQIHIPNVMLLPEDFCFDNLIRFKITVGKKYNFFGLKSCTLAGVPLMDKFMVLLTRAEALHLEKIEGLQEVLHDRGGQGSLMERHGLNPSGFFNNLIELTIQDCRLEYLFSLSCARGFPRLQTLQIFDCEMMEAIVGIKEEKDEDELSSQVINFSQLKYLSLMNLPKLISFYPKVEKMSTSEGNSSTKIQSLFNEKVAFPVLEVLKIWVLPNIIEIWGNQLLIASEKESKSFCQLKDMVVSKCEKLVHVVQFNMLPRLQNLITFSVDNCPKMEAIVSEKGKEGTTNNDIIVFSQLTTLNLSELVVFPVLEDLKIQELPNIIEIWDKQLLIASEKESKSFCQLKDIEVSNCEKLVHVVQFNMLPRLQNLKAFNVDNCPKMEAIVSDKEKEGTTSNDIIVFSQLTTLNLSELVSLKSFYNWPRRSEAQPLFNHQVSFPKLKTLLLDNCVNSREIHPWNVQVGKISLKFVDVANLDKLIVRNCSEVVEVFQLEGLNVGEGQHVRPLIEVKMMELDRLPQLTCLWNKDPRRILGLQSLQYLTIKKCSLLRNLFTCSIAMALQQLKVLYLESCPVMEEVIAATEDGLKEAIDDVIEFPKLEWLILKDLPNLNNFCNANYNFNLPSLQRIVLKRCPTMHNFTFGQVRMSQILVITRGNEGL
ncbi:disease resistance protein SUMM2-like [Camellia sinensis]|uniref:disease resistance protein SUMM2-like n=1 Tax=Camellia sinensis TaxID=4442 RepID=UPI001036557F|nr:disease resistance protein SUMM2-like [Camellia sinensis]